MTAAGHLLEILKRTKGAMIILQVFGCCSVEVPMSPIFPSQQSFPGFTLKTAKVPVYNFNDDHFSF